MTGRISPMLVGLMFSLCVISYFDRTAISIAAPAIMKEFGLSEQQMGTIFSAFLLPYALMMIPGGRLSDRIGPRKALTAMAMGSGLSIAALAMAGRPGLGALVGIVPAFVFLRVLFGVAQAPLFPAVNKANATWSAPDQRSLVQGLVASGAGLGSAFSPILCAWLVSRFGWQSAFLLAGTLTIAAGAVWYSYVQDDPQSHGAKIERPDWGKLFANRNLILITIGFFALDYFEYIFFYWTFYYFGEIRKIPATESAVYTTILYLTWLVMTPFGGKFSDYLSARFGRSFGLRATAMGCLTISAVLLYFGAGAENVQVAVALISLAFGFASCADVNFWAATIEVAGDQAGAAGGIMNAGGNLGGALAPALTPVIAASLGWAWGLYFGSIMAMVGVVVWLGVDLKQSGAK